MERQLSPRLFEIYQTLVIARRQRVLTAEEFRDSKARLLKQQSALNKRAEAERAKREAQRLRKEREAQAERERLARIAEEARRVKKREAEKKRRELKKASSRLTSDRIFSGVCGANISQFLRDAYNRTAGNNVIRVVSYNPPGVEAQNLAEAIIGAIMGSIMGSNIIEYRDIEIARPDDVKKFISLFFAYEDGEFVEYMAEGGTLEIYRPTPLDAQRMRQRFRDGISHCVFTPILSRLESALKHTESKDRKTRLRQKISKLNALSQEYETGVPVEAMETVAKASGFKITIHDILGKELFVFNEAGKCGNVRFTNTRPNHVDEGKIVLDSDSIKVDAESMRLKWKELCKSGEFYMIEGDLKNNEPRKIRTIDNVYELFDSNKEYYDSMNEMVNINKCKLNATKYPEVNQFIKAGRIINSWVTPFSDEKPTGHIDMPKAYTQFKKCAWYSGFLGVIHQWRTGNFDRQFLTDHVGIYQVSMKTSNPLFNKLGLSDSVQILPSPEILYFMDNGVECVVTAGVWGSRMDFDFPSDMLVDRRYAKWCGRLSMEYSSKKYTFECGREWAQHIKSDYGDDCFYWEDRRLCSVKVPISNVYTTHHILAFITSYVRIQMMEAMKQFNVDQLVKVVLDGIYYRGEKPECLDWFRPKEIIEHSYEGFAWYSPVDLQVDWSASWIPNNTLLMGQGGAGKTYKVMTDECFNKILFITPQHVLGGDVSNQYGVSYTTIHKLIGEGCESWLTSHAYPPVLFVDEITQISADWIDRIFEMYKDSLIILAGDLDANQWYQCRNGKPGDFSKVWKPVGVDMIMVEGDRRSRDDKLKQLKLDIRAKMRSVFIDGDTCEVNRMKMWACKTFSCVEFDKAASMFVPGDVWIAGTNKTSDLLLEKGVCSGWYKQGGHVSFSEKEDYTKRGSFTIHSFQGRTVSEGKIFISLNDMFEYSMLYTAVSRACYFDQLVFVA